MAKMFVSEINENGVVESIFLVKDNHIAAAGGIKNAIESVRYNIPHSVFGQNFPPRQPPVARCAAPRRGS